MQGFCDGRIPAELRDRVRVDFTVRGNSMTIRELRSGWHEDQGPAWTITCAQIRFEARKRLWTLYCDSNRRWHIYEDAPPGREVVRLVQEIDRDAHAVFWG